MYSALCNLKVLKDIYETAPKAKVIHQVGTGQRQNSYVASYIHFIHAAVTVTQ